MMTRKFRGFTLIELLVVVGILAVLVSILLPSLSRARRQAKRVVCATQVRSIAQGMINYAIENRDEVPLNEGTEPSYIYVRKGSSGDQQWLLAELILPYIGYEAPVRTGPNNSFTDKDFERAAQSGEIFYCPSTDNFHINNSDEFANWMDHSDWGAFMDYAQIWNWVGPFVKPGSLTNDSLIVTSVGNDGGAYAVLDDEQRAIAPRDWPDEYGQYEPMSGLEFRLPHNLTREPLQLPGASASSRVPMIMDYMVSRDMTPSEMASKWDSGGVLPQAANHIWGGRANRRGNVRGANYAYSDGSVEWRNKEQVWPRLTLLRTFSNASPYPTYWW